jgi:hypothetical protein
MPSTYHSSNTLRHMGHLKGRKGESQPRIILYIKMFATRLATSPTSSHFTEAVYATLAILLSALVIQIFVSCVLTIPMGNNDKTAKLLSS